MQKNNVSYLSRACRVLFVLMASVAILYVAKSLLAPLVFALVLAMLLIPLSNRMEKIGVNRNVAAFICIIVLISAFAIIIFLLSWQLSNLMSGMGQIKERLTEIGGQVQQYIETNIGIKASAQNEMIKNAGSESPVSLLAYSTGSLLGILVDTVLVLVYIFLMLCFRKHLMDFLIKAVPSGQKTNIADLVRQAGKISQQYLTGLALMIMTLWVMYGIGFSIVGVKYAIFFALLCGTLEMVPFIGNITGTTLTALMGIIQGGDLKLVASIVITYGVVQFIQSYVLQPLVVGKQVSLNPFFTIVSIVIGDAVWGVAGMVLAVPVFGMIKITCDHFEALKPYGFLLGEEKQPRSAGWILKIKRLFS